MADMIRQFSNLQAQAERNLVEFLRSEVSVCFTFASIAENELKVGNRELAKQSIADAEKGYATLRKFLSEPKFAKHLSDPEKREFSEATERLRNKLDKLTV